MPVSWGAKLALWGQMSFNYGEDSHLAGTAAKKLDTAVYLNLSPPLVGLLAPGYTPIRRYTFSLSSFAAVLLRMGALSLECLP